MLVGTFLVIRGLKTFRNVDAVAQQMNKWGPGQDGESIRGALMAKVRVKLRLVAHKRIIYWNQNTVLSGSKDMFDHGTISSYSQNRKCSPIPYVPITIRARMNFNAHLVQEKQHLLQGFCELLGALYMFKPKAKILGVSLVWICGSF